MPESGPNKYAVCPKCRLNRFYVRHGTIEVKQTAPKVIQPTMQPTPPPVKMAGFEVECQNCGNILLQGVTQ